MNTSPLCPECGKPVPAGSQHQVCPACLLAQALASRTIVEGGNQAPVSPPPSPEEIADKFPGFEILECLGRGGMGVVYKVRQKSLNRMVAIKILPPECAGQEKFSERFAIEAQTLARLNHQNIVSVFDFGEADGLFYIVMEFVDGVNLRDLLRDGKLEPKQALAIVPPICDALQYAHDKGIVHRDIKPENLLLDRDGRIKIADFGIAKLIGASGDLAGTPPYMAPEQSGAKPEVDHRADIYALGVVLYEMLTGERPDRELVAPSRKVQIDVRLDEMVLRALEKEPERRYQTAGEFRTVVETMAGAQPGISAPVQPQLLRSGECLYATPEFLATVWGAMKLHQGMGALLLYSDRLEFQAGLLRTVIPLGSVRRLDLIRYPFFQSPAGLRSIEVEYEDAGTPRRLVLTPSKGMFSFVGTTNNRVFEWLGAIREAVRNATGSPPAGSSSPIPYQGFSADGRLVSAFAMLASFTALFGILTALAMTGSWRNLLPAAVPFIFGVSFVLALAWRQRRQWLSEHPLPEQPPDISGRPANASVFTVVAVALLLVLTATGNAIAMMIGSALLLVIGLIWFTKGNFRLALLVVLASLGVAGGVALLMKQKHAANVTGPAKFPPLPPGYEQGKTPPLPPGYEGNRNAAPRSASPVAAESSAMAFGPVIERRVGDVASHQAPELIDLETGTLLFQSEVLGDTARLDMQQTLKLFRERGVDATGTLDPNTRGLAGWEIVALPVAESAWDHLTPVELDDALKGCQPGSPVVMPGTGTLPATYVFKTRSGGMGILQITGFTDNPRGVKFRYKLVRRAADLQPVSAEILSELARMRSEAAKDIESRSKQPAEEDPGFERRIQERADRAEELLRGTVAEPVIMEQHRLVREIAAAKKAGDETLLKKLEAETDRVNVQLDKLLQLTGNAQPAQSKPVTPDYSQAEKPDAGSADENALQSIENIKAINDANRFLDLELAVIDAKASGMGDKHPSVIVASDMLARFKETHPNTPDTVWRQVVGQRLDKAKEDLAALSAGGLGKVHPNVVAQQARIRTLAELIGKPVVTEAKEIAAPENQRDKILIEDLALHMIVAIREKNDDKLRSMATDRIKGWRDALPVFAVEMREHYRQMTGDEKFDMRAGESLVEGDLAAVKCTGPEKLKGVCLILFFVKADDGWRNHSLRASTENTPLAKHMADFKKENEKENSASPAEKTE